MEDGERMLIPCDGGPSTSRLVRYPPPLEIDERDGMYVLVDDGPPDRWRYEFVGRGSVLGSLSRHRLPDSGS